MARITNIKLRRSATSGAIPTTANLDLGEIALNTYDGKAYMKKDVGGNCCLSPAMTTLLALTIDEKLSSGLIWLASSKMA